MARADETPKGREYGESEEGGGDQTGGLAQGQIFTPAFAAFLYFIARQQQQGNKAPTSFSCYTHSGGRQSPTHVRTGRIAPAKEYKKNTHKTQDTKEVHESTRPQTALPGDYLYIALITEKYFHDVSRL